MIVSVAHNKQHQATGQLKDNKCAGICKEMVIVNFEVLHHHLYGGNEADHKNHSHDRQLTGQDLKF